MDKEEKAQALEVLKKLTAYLEKEVEVPEGKVWPDFWEMAKDIRTHAKENNYAIIQYDRPAQLQLGFKCATTGKTWHIRIADVRKALDSADTDQDVDVQKIDLLEKAIKTANGKEALLAAFNAK